MNEIEHIPKCPKNGEVNLLYLIKGYQYQVKCTDR